MRSPRTAKLPSIALFFIAGCGFQVHAQFLQIRVQQGGEISQVAANGIYVANTPVNTSLTMTVQLTNRGSTPLRISSISLTGASQFALSGSVPQLPVTISGNASISFQVIFRPTSGSRVAADVSVFYNEVPDTGTPGPISVTGFTFAGTAGLLSANVSLPPDNNFVRITNGGVIEFPPVPINTSLSATVVIVNRGSGAGTVGAVALTGADFQLQGLPILPSDVDPGQELRFNIRFLPKQAAPSSGSLSVTLDGAITVAALQGSSLSSLLSYALVVGEEVTNFGPDALLALPPVPVGEAGVATVQVRNNSRLDANVNSIQITGPGFTLIDAPALPLVVPPGAGFTYSFSYAPPQLGRVAGRMRLNLDAFTLETEGLASRLQFTGVINGTEAPLPSGSTLAFGQVEAGGTSRANVRVANVGSAPATISSIAVTQGGDVFRIASLPGLPATIEPQGSIEFTIEMKPPSAGTYNGSLSVGNVTFGLNGTGTPQAPPAPLPGYRFEVGSATLQPRQSTTVSLILAAPYSRTISGTLALSFIPELSGSDPAVQFAVGGRLVRFVIPTGATRAVFETSQEQIRLQSGSVAGSILLTPSFSTTSATGSSLNLTPELPTTFTITVPSAPPQLFDANIAPSSASSFILNITGLATTRNLNAVDVKFTGANTVNLAGTDFRINIRSAADSWYANTNSEAYGSQFVVSIPFTLTSDVEDAAANLVQALQTVSVSATNDRGVSNTLSVNLR